AAVSAHGAGVPDGSYGRAGNGEEHAGGPDGGAAPKEQRASWNYCGGSEQPLFGRSDSRRPDSNAGACGRRGDFYSFDGHEGISRGAFAGGGGGGAASGC